MTSLLFSKQAHSFKTNQGRVSATQKGIQMAKNDWLLFVRSNLTLNSNTIYEYLKSSRLVSPVAFMGQIIYNSSDEVFANYLNSNKRGINPYKHLADVHFKYLLFGNCLIHSKVFKNIQLNHSLKYYGGEELDFASKLEKKFPKMMTAQE